MAITHRAHKTAGIVRIVETGNNHSPVGGCMGKTTMPQIDTGVINTPSTHIFKENQIPALQKARPDTGSAMKLQSGGTWQVDAIDSLIDMPGKGGAIQPPAGLPSVQIGNAQPGGYFLLQNGAVGLRRPHPAGVGLAG